MCTERNAHSVVKRDYLGLLSWGRWRLEGRGGLCGGNREQKNTRFFVQVNISARGPCLTGNARSSDPFWTNNWEASKPAFLHDHLHGYSTGGGARGAPTIVREENYFIFHVTWQTRATGMRLTHLLGGIFLAISFLPPR